MAAANPAAGRLFDDGRRNLNSSRPYSTLIHVSAELCSPHTRWERIISIPHDLEKRRSGAFCKRRPGISALVSWNHGLWEAFPAVRGSRDESCGSTRTQRHDPGHWTPKKQLIKNEKLSLEASPLRQFQLPTKWKLAQCIKDKEQVEQSEYKFKYGWKRKCHWGKFWCKQSKFY